MVFPLDHPPFSHCAASGSPLPPSLSPQALGRSTGDPCHGLSPWKPSSWPYLPALCSDPQGAHSPFGQRDCHHLTRQRNV